MQIDFFYTFHKKYTYHQTSIMRPEHIGIAVADKEQAVTLFSTLLNAQPYKSEQVASESVETIFFKTGETKIELLLPIDNKGPIASFLEKRGPGMHHIAFEVQNIENEILRLRQAGFEFISETPKQGADNKRICFLHPKSSGGVLVELCETIKTQ